MVIRTLAKRDLDNILEFTNRAIGKNYFSRVELDQIFDRSQSSGTMCSFVLVDDSEMIRGVRIAYPPGNWSQGKGTKLRPELWRVALEDCAYFQSLFLDPSARGEGYGPKLSAASIDAFRFLGAKAIVTHAWRESPQNSAVRYLAKAGFESVATHSEYWKDIDYECVLDGNPCLCSAEEMIKYLGEEALA